MQALTPLRHSRLMGIAQNLNHVVIVDDEPELGSTLKDHFESTGVSKVEAFTSALEAYNYCVKQIETKKLPQLILSDLTMPKMTGLELLRKIRDNSFLKEIPFMLMTAYGEEERVREAIRAGANDVIMKPFAYEFLNTRVLSLLERVIEK